MNIAYLADHRDVIPTLAEWFYQEWSYLHPGRTLNDVRQMLVERANKKQLPFALVAFEGSDLLGTVSIKVHDMDTRPDLGPWLAGLYVAAPWRGRGRGTMLVSAIEDKARQLDIRMLYLYTPQSEAFYSRLGWSLRERVEYHDVPVSVMGKQIAP